MRFPGSVIPWSEKRGIINARGWTLFWRAATLQWRERPSHGHGTRCADRFHARSRPINTTPSSDVFQRNESRFVAHAQVTQVCFHLIVILLLITYLLESIVTNTSDLESQALLCIFNRSYQFLQIANFNSNTKCRQKRIRKELWWIQTGL